MESIALSEIRGEVVSLAAIDGQTGTTSRHPTATLNARINRYWAQARSIVASSGEPWFQVVSSASALPAPLTGENHIEVATPVAALEILGVDVMQNGVFGDLDAASWRQRRKLDTRYAYPEGGIGWFTIKSAPEARSSASITAGIIAVFPIALTGSQYRITSVEQWTAITSDTHLFVGTSDMIEWTILSTVLATIGRDQNKKGSLNDYLIAKQEAEERMKKATQRGQRAGAITPMRAGGEIF